MIVKDLVLNTKNQLEDDLAIKFSYMDKKLGVIQYVQKDVQECSQNIEDVSKDLEGVKDKIQAQHLKVQFSINQVREAT